MITGDGGEPVAVITELRYGHECAQRDTADIANRRVGRDFRKRGTRSSSASAPVAPTFAARRSATSSTATGNRSTPTCGSPGGWIRPMRRTRHRASSPRPTRRTGSSVSIRTRRASARSCGCAPIASSRTAARPRRAPNAAAVCSSSRSTSTSAERDTLARLASPALDPDALFHQEFVRALFERAVRLVRDEFEHAGKPLPFALFERYDLAPRDGDSYAALAADFGVTSVQVTNALALARRRFREHALAALRMVCATTMSSAVMRASCSVWRSSDHAVRCRCRAAARRPRPGRSSSRLATHRRGDRPRRMGTVYRATDALLGREVAIKVPNGFGATAVGRRLRVEAGVLARLEHPGIVPIHDAGQLADGRLFYVMKLVRGQTLRAQLPRCPAERASRRVRADLRAGRVRPRPRPGASRPEARQRHDRRVRRSAGDGLGRRAVDARP